MKKKGVKISFLGFSLICLICWIPSCAVNPVSGKQELMLLSESSEIDLGRQSHNFSSCHRVCEMAGWRQILPANTLIKVVEKGS